MKASPSARRAGPLIAIRCALFWPLLWSLLWALASCGRAPGELALSGPTMGTTYTVKIVQPPRAVDESAVRRAIEDVLALVDRSMSGYRDDSEIVRFNASRMTDWIEVSADLAAVVQTALSVSEQSDGAFDVTVAPVVNAWGFGPGVSEPEPPDRAALALLRERIGWRKLHVRTDTPALRKDDPELEVDLNGVAPGYAVDLLAAQLEALAIANFMIDIGGEIRVRGHNARGERWRVAVERPIDAAPDVYATLRLTDSTVATSGEYRNYYVRDGRRYSHTIDPRTLQPVSHTLASVVVIGPSAAFSDAWATAYNVLGGAEGRKLAEQLDMPVMFIEHDGEGLHAHMTRRFERYVEGNP